MARYSPKIKDWPEDDRPRERLARFGPAALSDAEIMAILLRVGNHDTTALDLARRLLTTYGGFRGLDAVSIPELCQVNGIGPAKAAQIKAALELGKRLFLEKTPERPKVESSEDVYRLVSPHLRDLSHEVFRVLFLTSRNRVLADKVLFTGSLTESIVSPREIVREAVNQTAASVVFVHNHPSGNPEPSEEDKRVTRRLKQACEVVGVEVLDHIIVGEKSYFSFADSGLI